jgi:enterochelin esterase family protein
VYCSSGSFVQMPGGNPYPHLIRETPRKPLRIWLHAATRDLNWDKPERNWLSANLEVAAALAERGFASLTEAVGFAHRPADAR